MDSGQTLDCYPLQLRTARSETHVGRETPGWTGSLRALSSLVGGTVEEDRSKTDLGEHNTRARRESIPTRVPSDVPLYNEIALKVMRENGVQVDDLYAFALPRMKSIQQPVNVHFTPAGSNLLAEQVAKSIEPSLPRKD